MASKLLWAFFFVSVCTQAAVLAPDVSNPNALKPDLRQAKAAHLAAELLSRYHYRPLPLDESLSARIFDHYLNALDPHKIYFDQNDVDRLSIARSTMGPDILQNDLVDAFAIFNVYVKRATERYTYARSVLKAGFSAHDLDTYRCEAGHQARPKTEAAARDLWRLRVKSDWLRQKQNGLDDKSIVEVLDKRYGNTLARIARVDGEDAFQTYMNAYTTAIEPHTHYFIAPRATASHDGSSGLAMVGIGAVLSEDGEYASFQELVPGGAALLSGQLHVGDRIVGIGQGQTGAVTDVVGMRLDDIIALIRGTAGTVVRLEILAPDAGLRSRSKHVALVRQPVTLQQQGAKSSVQTVAQGNNTLHRVGVITLASFYEDFEGKKSGRQDYRSAARDVVRLIADLKQERVDSILVDLRGNGGGSLTQALELAALFVGPGPVLQTRNAGGTVRVERASQTEKAWDGPMGVLMDRTSAAASEIFAAAIQDYGRGVVMGEPSFGEGTVQTMVDLDRLAKNVKPQFGELKMTVAQTFRVNGAAIQVHGVAPDIVFPSVPDAGKLGESKYENAIPWAEIKPAVYAPTADLQGVLPMLRSLHAARIRNIQDFKFEARTAARESAIGCVVSAELAVEKLRTNENDVLLLESIRILADESDAVIAQRGPVP